MASPPILEVGDEGGSHATVMFRSGVTDETVRQRGWTHLAEHVLLTGAPLDHSVHGSVGSHFTYFSFAGSTDEVLERLHALAAALADLPVRQLPAERRILEAEAERREGRSVEEHLLVTRFGLRGPGLLASGEVGLADVSARQLQAWVASRFTTGNCAVVLHNIAAGDAPTMSLPQGSASDVVAARSLERDWPGSIPLDEAGPAWGGVVNRGPAARLAADVLQARALQVLRQRHGVAYSPYVGYQPLDDAHAHLALVVDAPRSRRDQAGRLLPRLVADVADAGPTQLEMDAAIARRLSVKPNAVSTAYADAHCLLWPAASAESERADWGAVGREDVRTAIADAAETSLFAVTEAVIGQVDARRVAPWSTRQVAGAAHRRRGRSALGARNERLVVSQEGIMHERAPSDRDTIMWPDVVAVERYLDGARTLLGVDGAVISLVPSRWRGGEDVTRAVDEHVEPSAVIRMPERGDPDAIRKHPPMSTGLRIGIALVVPAVLALFATLNPVGWVVAAVLVVVLVGNIRHERYGG